MESKGKKLSGHAQPPSARAAPHTRCSSCLCRQGRGFLLRALVGVEGGRTRRPARPEHRRQQNWKRAEGEDLLEQVRATAHSLSTARKLLEFLLEVQLTLAVLFVHIDARGAFLAAILPVLGLPIEPVALALISRRQASVGLGIWLALAVLIAHIDARGSRLATILPSLTPALPPHLLAFLRPRLFLFGDIRAATHCLSAAWNFADLWLAVRNFVDLLLVVRNFVDLLLAVQLTLAVILVH